MKFTKLFAAVAVFVCLFLGSCSDDSEPKSVFASGYTGVHTGTMTLNVADRFNYEAVMDVAVTGNEDTKTLTVNLPEYTLTGTMIGDITIGALTIDGLVWNEELGGYYRSYGGQGLTMHFKAVQNGTTTMDNDYPLNETSTILVRIDSDGKLVMDNPFQLGAMPLPLTATFKAK